MVSFAPPPKKPLLIRPAMDGNWAAAWFRIVRSNHDMWTLELKILEGSGGGESTHTEHILIGDSQRDDLMALGVPVKNPPPKQNPLRGKGKW